MPFGLTAERYKNIKAVFSRFSVIDEVLVFGSRAMDTYKPASDIDLALIGEKITHDDLIKARLALDELPYGYTYDVVDYKKTINPAFKKHIDKFGISFYKKEHAPEKWLTFKLGDLVEMITKGTTPSTLGGRFVEKGVNFIKSEAISYEGRIDKSTFVFIDEATHEKLKRSQLQKDDILFSMAGIYLGKNAIVTEDVLPANTNQALAIIRLEQKKATPKFVHYYLSQPDIIKQINSMSGQSAQPNINFEEIKSIEIKLPEINSQKEISSILSSLDNKIELNLQMNQTLEAMAQAIFKEWFVEFKINGKKLKTDSSTGLPKGWEVGKIGDHLNTILGGTPSTINKSYWENGTIAWINSGKVNEFRIIQPTTYITKEALNNSNTRLLPSGTTVIAVTGATLGQVSRLEIDACANQSVVGILESKSIKSEFIYLWVKKNILEIIKGQTGGAQQHVNKNDINNSELLVPTSEIQMEFKKVIAPIFEKIRINCFENNTLTQLKDSLLPKLMTGKIVVPS